MSRPEVQAVGATPRHRCCYLTMGYVHARQTWRSEYCQRVASVIVCLRLFPVDRRGPWGTGGLPVRQRCYCCQRACLLLLLQPSLRPEVRVVSGCVSSKPGRMQYIISCIRSYCIDLVLREIPWIPLWPCG